jgi:hypothetical protein
LQDHAERVARCEAPIKTIPALSQTSHTPIGTLVETITLHS